MTACAAIPEPVDAAADAHGYVEGATEATEPQLTLATIDAAGTLALLDLLDETTTPVAVIEGATAVSTDGRFVFASSASAAGSGDLTIVDTGVWTVDHQDHSHYYRAEPRVVGALEGAGAAVVTGGGSTVAVTSPDGGAVLLDHAALGTGEIERVGEIAGATVAAPVGSAVLAGIGDTAVVATPTGETTAEAACPDPAGSIGTRVGTVIGCADGAVLATSDADGTVTLEHTPYPRAVATGDRAVEFRGRAGRPTVAAVAGSTGAWLLDTRERSWTLLPTEVPLLLVAAADDSDGRIVALAADGRVLVLDPTTGATVAATAPLLAATVADPALLAGVELSVDANRAYVNAPAEGVVYELDYADSARVARTFPVPGSPVFVAETGR
nr:hypothetical protein [Conyzicola lurida]